MIDRAELDKLEMSAIMLTKSKYHESNPGNLSKTILFYNMLTPSLIVDLINEIRRLERD